MKKILFFLAFFSFFLANAQKEDCATYVTEYKGLLNEGRINEAYLPWISVKKNCPKLNEELYLDGFKILQYKADNLDGEEKEKMIDEILSLHDAFFKNFPEKNQQIELDKALVLIKNSVENKNKIYNWLEIAFSKYQEKIIDVQAFINYFKLSYEKFSEAEKTLTSDKLIERYILLNGLLDKISVSNPEKEQDYSAAQRAINGIANNVMTCENLDSYFTKEFSKNNENIDWLSSSLNTLQNKCSDLSLFKAMASKYYSLSENNISAKYLAIASLKERNFDNAKKYYVKSAELESNPIEKAKTYYTLATSLYSSEPQKSKEYLKKSIDFNPQNGRTYLYLAQLYVNNISECYKTDFDKKIIYYLAIKTAQKAQEVEPILKSYVSRFNAENGKYALTDNDIKDGKLSGKSIKLGCWINETIVLP